MKRTSNSKNEILEKACSLFIKKGFSATTTREITDSLKLSPGALYVHFKNKEEIFRLVINQKHPWLEIPAVIGELEGNNIDSLVKEALEKLEKKWAEKPDLVKLHLIEIVEFNGVHLPDLFEETLNKSFENFLSLQKVRPELQSIEGKLFHRALLGIFFGYTFLNRSITGIPAQMDQGIYGYFSDVYLRGITDFKKEGDAE